MHWPKEAELMEGGCLMQLWTHLKEVIRNMEECLAYSVNARQRFIWLNRHWALVERID